jgi:hemolysin activation/secretion protein
MKCFWFISFWFISGLLLVLSASSAEAQVPDPILPREPEPLPVEPPAELSPNPLSLPAPSPAAPRFEIPGSIRVERFEFEGNTALSDRALAEATQAFTGRSITFTELLQAEDAVTRLYTAAGYINSGAIIPAGQTIDPDRAIVTVQVIEGELAAIQVSGTRRLNESYIRSRLERAARPPLNQQRLLEALQLLQLDPRIQRISAQLQAGTRPEQSLLEVQVQEADPLSLAVSADNGRSPSVGRFRRGVQINQANLLGIGDDLALSYTNTDGSNAVDLSYTVPINPQDGTVQIAAGITDTRVIEEPFDRIDITGDARIYELSYRQPLWREPSQEFAIGVTASRLESDTFLQEQRFSLSPGADSQGRTRISVLRFVQEFTQRHPRTVFTVRSQFSLGLNLLDATVNDDAPDSRFFVWRGQAQYVRLLAPETLLLLRSDVQLTPDALVSLEQFGVGGLNSVRGYRQDVLLADNGIFASAELRLPVLRVPAVSGALQVVPFVDFSVGWNDADAEPTQTANTLLSLGMGMLWQMDDRLSVRVDYGIPLIELTADDEIWRDDSLYFTVNYVPF